MNQVDTIFLICLAACLLLGYMMGFGRALKRATSGIFGIIISIFVCFMLGGTVRNIPAVDAFVTSIDDFFIGIAGFLRYLQLGRVVYYICFFFFVQICRIIIVRSIISIDKTDNKAIKTTSRIFGAIFLASFCLLLCFLALAIVKVLENTAFAQDIVQKIQNSFLSYLYTNNPIKL